MRKLATLCLGLLLCQNAYAEDDWYVKSDIQSMTGQYANSTQRSSLTAGGLFLSADYLDHGGFTLGYNYTNIKFKAPLKDIKQHDITGNIRMNFRTDSLPGVLTLRFDVHGINNNDVTGNTDAVKTYGAQLSFVNYAKSMYMDLGYNYSRYQFKFNVQQFTPTLGMGFNEGADWLQLRGYLIRLSDKNRAQGKGQTNALEAKWTHWFGVNNFLAVDNLRANAVLGERIYAVDNDSSSVYNLSDLQTAGYSLGLEWKFGDHMSVLFVAGLEKYENKLIKDKYDSRMAYIDLGYQW